MCTPNFLQKSAAAHTYYTLYLYNMKYGSLRDYYCYLYEAITCLDDITSIIYGTDICNLSLEWRTQLSGTFWFGQLIEYHNIYVIYIIRNNIGTINNKRRICAFDHKTASSYAVKHLIRCGKTELYVRMIIKYDHTKSNLLYWSVQKDPLYQSEHTSK